MGDFHPFLVHIIEAFDLGVGIKEIFTVMVARDEKQFAVKNIFDSLMHWYCLVEHLLLRMVHFVVVTIGGVSSNEAVVKFGLGVVVNVGPVSQLLYGYFIKVDVSHERYL